MIIQLACFNRNTQAILARRERAGRKWREGPRRIDRHVEVKHDRFAFGQIGVEKTTCPVSRFAAGRIAEDEKELDLAFKNRVQTILLAIEFECHIAGACHFVYVAEYVGNLDLLRLIVTNERSRDAIRLVDGEPSQTCELASLFAVFIFDADAISL